MPWFLTFTSYSLTSNKRARESIANAMHELGIPLKLVRLTLKGTKGRVSKQQNMTSLFNITSDIKCDALSTTIF